MTYTFYLQCYTQFGQNLYLQIGSTRYAMEYVAHGTWRSIVECEELANQPYSYEIEDENAEILTEGDDSERLLPQCDGSVSLQIYDEFRLNLPGNPLRTYPFENVFCPHQVQPRITTLQKHSFLLQADMPGVAADHGVGLLGDADSLGAWKSDKILPLNYIGNSMWQLLLVDAEKLQGAEYKLVVYELETRVVVRWEEGFNRSMPLLGDAAMVTIQPRQKYTWRGAGVAIPLFSLRSEESWGVGDFEDLKKLIDWAVATKQSLVQLLPINDTTQQGNALDSYPYRAISIYALHPLYIRPEPVAGDLFKEELKSYLKARKRLNSLDALNYTDVYNLKRDCFYNLYSLQGKMLFDTQDFKQFYKKQEHWLQPYAVFCVLRDMNRTAHYSDWKELSVYDAKQVDAFAKKEADAVGFYYFLQYHANKQLLEARDYAHKHGVVLKGDLPIGISGDSVEAWMQPSLFHLECEAGAPPDAFSEIGQNWGFPTYNWEAMSHDGYHWWKGRFEMMEQYFDAFRIDHVLGFFRIWTIPPGAIWGLLGYFVPALPFSKQELADHGIEGNLKRFCVPYITNGRLVEQFEDLAPELVSRFMETADGELYGFKPEFATQRQLFDYINNHPELKYSEMVVQRLLELYCDVLLIEDRERPGYYHPRIHLHRSFPFSALSLEEKQNFQQLHDFYFYERHDAFWRESALQKLPELLATTRMLVCAEDLGMLPACVAPTLALLQILTLEIERMPKNDERLYVDPELTSYWSVFSTGTHDMSTLRGWWEENPKLIHHYYNEVLGLKGVAPNHCTPTVAEAVIRHALSANSMWVVLPWQDYMAMDGEKRGSNPADERINIPANPLHQWTYRMPITLDELLCRTFFNEHLAELVQMSGR